MFPSHGVAQIVADPGAPASQRPVVTNAANGVPLVNIQTPSAAGVSRNTYSQFDVQKQGALLNNSRANVQTQLGGYVQGNPYLAGGTAKVILNEVNSSNPSHLNGYVEVAGARAQVVIANPAGIACDGCGFINASRTTLTTGTPIMNNGNLEGYRVEGGVITIHGAGMDASRVDYTDIIARAVNINAGIWANELRVTTGTNQVNAENTTATPTPGTGTAPAVAIDVASLGGMYAGKIKLMGTEAGVGVRNAGYIGASAGEVVITAEGKIENTGRVVASNNIAVDNRGDIQNSGTIFAKGNTSISTTHNLDNSGVIAAQNDVGLTATGVSSQIKSTTGAVLAAGVQDDGSIGTSGTLTVSATETVTAQGQNLSGGDQSFSAQTLDLSGSQTDGRNTRLHASKGDVNVSGAAIYAAQTLTANANQTLRTDQAKVEAAQINISATDLSNVKGAIVQYGTGDMALHLPGNLDNTQGLIATNGLNVDVMATAIANTGGTIQHAGAGKLAIQSDAISNTGGTIIASKQLAIDSNSLGGDGALLSQGDLSIKLKQNFSNTGQVLADGSLALSTDGTLVNHSRMEAGNAVNVTASSIDNQAAGEIAGTGVTFKTTDASSASFTNRGVINGYVTDITTHTLNNLGSGSIYGNHVAIAAITLNNAAEGGVAPVVAARERLDIGAENINNREHALLFSAGDMAIGGKLDANRLATDFAKIVNNNSATIDASGNLAIAATQINNTNEHFSTQVSDPVSESVVEYQGSGSPNRYAEGTPDLYTYKNESIHLHTPEGNYSSWTRYNYTRSTTEEQLKTSDPGQILSGGTMNIIAGNLLNDKSRIIAGETLNVVINDPSGALTNNDGTGVRTITESGIATSYWRHSKKGTDSTSSQQTLYNPPAMVQTITVLPVVYLENTKQAGTGTKISDLAITTVSQTAAGASAGPTPVIRTGGINAAIPNNSLFHLNVNPSGGYLIETDPRFANYRNWLSSDYMLKALSVDPATTMQRLGDGFYEQKLVREQVAQLTGRRFLDGYASDEAQYQSLMDNAVTFAQAQQLRPGVALSAEQMAALTSDIIWLVEKEVTLPNGQTTKALVPQLYVRVQKGDLDASGALLAGNNVNLNVAGSLTNMGTIAGRNIVSLTAENVKNIGGRISGKNVGVVAMNDLDNVGGKISAENSLYAMAGNDLNVVSTTSTQTNARGTRTNIDRVAGLYVTGGEGILVASAGNDINLNAAAIVNSVAPTSAGDGAVSGSTTIVAGNNLNLGTVTESASNKIVWNGSNYRKESSRTDVGTVIQTQGDVVLQAGQDLTAKGANVTSEQGTILARAVGNLSLTAGETNVTVEEAHKHKSKGFLSKKTTTTLDTLDQTTAQGTTLSGNTVQLESGKDVSLKGSNVVATKNVQINAVGDVNIESASDATTENHFKSVKKSGLMSSGGIGFTIGKRIKSTDNDNTIVTAVASTVGSTEGNVSIEAGKNYKQVGSDVMAPQGNVDIAAQKVDILEAQDTSKNATQIKFKQSGLTVAVNAPVITALQTAQSMYNASQKTDDKRMQGLAAASTALSVYNAGAQTLAATQSGDKSGGVSISITVGGAKSDSKTTQTSTAASGSTVAAGGDVNITARGAGESSNVTIQGSDVTAGNDVNLKADNQINLLAAQNSSELERNSKSVSGGVGVAISYSGGKPAIGFTANAAGSLGGAEGKEQSWTHTRVTAGNKLAMTSGGDTNIKGAVASGKQVVADVGGNLNIESLQDTVKYKSKDTSLGGSMTVGYGFSASGSASLTKVDADYASVKEQSGIKAGDKGFQVNVKGNTDLKGGIIASTDKAVADGKNTLTTDTLTTSSIENRDKYKAQSYSVSFGGGGGGSGAPGANSMNLSGTKPSGSAGYSNESGSQRSTTQSGISGGTITIANENAQKQLTGQDVTSTVASLNRDVSTDKDTSNALTKAWDANKLQEKVQAEAQIVQKFGEQASAAVGNYAEIKKNNLLAEAKNKTGDEKATLESEAAKWAEGGAYRVAMHAAVGGLTGNIEGALGAGLSAATIPDIAKQINELDVPQGVKETLIAAAGTTVGAAVGGAAGATAAANQTINNYLNHTKPELMRLSEKERFENAVAACNNGDKAACGTRDELALISLQRDEALKNVCLTGSADRCRAAIRVALDMGNVVYGRYGGLVYANSPEQGVIRSLNTVTVGVPDDTVRTNSYHYQQSQSLQQGIVLTSAVVLPELLPQLSTVGWAATGGGVSAGTDALGQYLQNGDVRWGQTGVAGLIGAVSTPLGMGYGVRGQVVIGGTGGAANAYFKNEYYGDSNSIIWSSVVSAAANVMGYKGSQNIQQLYPVYQAGIPALLQRPDYSGVVIGNTGGQLIQSMPNVFPSDIPKKNLP